MACFADRCSSSAESRELLSRLVLAGEQPLDVVANLMGDFVRGPLDERIDSRFHDGIRLHRRIDSFTDAHLPSSWVLV